MKIKNNNILTFAAVLTAAILGTSCTAEPSIEPDLSLEAMDELTEVTADGKSAATAIPVTGGESRIKVRCDAEYKIILDTDSPWFTISEEDNVITISAQEIVSDYEREGMIRVKAGTSTYAYISVSQTGSEKAEATFSSDSLNVRELGGTFKVGVSSNKEWETGTIAEDWITAVREGDSLVITVTQNMAAEKRTGIIPIKAGTEINNASAELPVIQDPWTEAYITPAQEEVAVPEEGGSTAIQIESNRIVSATSSDSWITVSMNKDCSALFINTEEASGEGTITLKSEGDDSVEKTIKIVTYDKPLVMEFTITDTSLEVSAPVNSPANYYVDWGDGTSEAAAAGESGAFTRPTHKYSETGTYTVKIYGRAGGLMTGFGNNWAQCITKIVDWGDLGITSLKFAFYNAGIESLPENSGEVFRNVTDFTSAFTSCVNLKYLPEKLFAGTLATSMQATFQYCTSLEEVPGNIFEGADKLENITAIFMGCTALKEIPEGLFDSFSNVTRAVNVFAECSSLEIIPEGLLDNMGKVTTFTGIFRNTAIKSIPDGFFDGLTNLDNCMQVFYGCPYLETIPVSLFDKCTKVSSFMGVFEGCTSLHGESPYSIVSGEKVHLYERSAFTDIFTEVTNSSGCFKGCTGLDDFADIPDTWK